jgi:murein DD-endopeptidase MepM/ murein hydrolase activator NlpD
MEIRLLSLVFYRLIYSLTTTILIVLIVTTIPLDAKSDKLVEIYKKEKRYELFLDARSFSQGEVIHLRLKPAKPGIFKENFKVIADNVEIPLATQGENKIGFIPIPPERNLNPMIIELHSKILFVRSGFKKYEIDIHKTDFLVIKKQSISLNKKFTTKKLPQDTLDFIKECTEAKIKAFSTSTDLQFSSGFVDPVKYVHFTSPFYVRRDYNNKKGRPHGGLDYRGKEGTSIFAIQDGTVVLARPMYYEGNFTIIDHGNKIFSFYMHQSEIQVKPGDKVKKGDTIGKIGSTGMSTGPHLHLGVKVNDVLVNPLGILAFRD